MPQNPPTWVADAASFEAMLKDLRRCTLLAVDTESNSLFAYREQVCLIQLSTGKKDYLVDPLVLDSLAGLGEVFADPHIEKVFHAAEYDLICLKRDFDFNFTSLFDTMVAARILGREAVGLASVLEAEFEIVLNKKYQRADWGQRPLLRDQMEYARLDSYFLIPLRARMAGLLAEKGQGDLAREDFQRLCRVRPPAPQNGDPVWSVAGRADLTPRQAAVLRELIHYRENQAMIRNRPVFKILPNDTLVLVAQNCPENERSLMALEGLNPRVVQRHTAGLLEAVHRGQQAEPLYRPPSRRPDERYLNRLERLRDWRKETARLRGVESDVVLPRDLLEEIARANPQNLQELAGVMESAPWRMNQYGEEILKRCL